MDNSPRYIKWNERLFAKIGEIHDLAYCYMSVDSDKCPNCGHDLGKHQFTSIPISPNHQQCASEPTFDDFANLINQLQKSVIKKPEPMKCGKGFYDLIISAFENLKFPNSTRSIEFASGIHQPFNSIEIILDQSLPDNMARIGDKFLKI